MSGVSYDLFDELLGVRRQEAPRVPGDAGPPPDRDTPVNEGYGPDAAPGNLRVRGNNRDPVSCLGQRSERMGRTTFQQHARPDVADVTRAVEPLARVEVAAQEQERLVGQLRD